MPPPRESWLVDEPASAESLDALRAAVPGLPDSYLDLLGRGNGGEVSLKPPLYTLCLDSAEVALSYWKSGSYTIRNAFVFGGDGGGTLFALDMRTTPWSAVSFDPVDPEGSMERIAADFAGFLAALERED